MCNVYIKVQLIIWHSFCYDAWSFVSRLILIIRFRSSGVPLFQNSLVSIRVRKCTTDRKTRYCSLTSSTLSGHWEHFRFYNKPVNVFVYIWWCYLAKKNPSDIRTTWGTNPGILTRDRSLCTHLNYIVKTQNCIFTEYKIGEEIDTSIRWRLRITIYKRCKKKQLEWSSFFSYNKIVKFLVFIIKYRNKKSAKSRKLPNKKIKKRDLRTENKNLLFI